ncbi:MHFG family PEP-CTERM protein [Roseateles oligotrophus]|uniref:MHFG family PEP-CTERM protein n=1 Tax=Roseateles oligotrophus TaxID=1769250 RepID=A0ABT2YGS0_9BURK|nr:MHFG family PEP-CTERM protein [Roseateles oligotrophus]MCV2369242.1 MHFG family PEP-CTERM protein [Roseateles oligotrophus]
MALTAIALAAGMAATTGTCDWHPSSQAAFEGPLAPLVERFQDIPIELRERLKRRIEEHQFDEVVAIQRDAIIGKQHYGDLISGLQAGVGSSCSQPSREQWSESTRELALSYCEGGYCVLITINGHHFARMSRSGLANDATALAANRSDALDPSQAIDLEPTAAAPAPLVHAPGRLLIGARAGVSDAEMSKLLSKYAGRASRIGRGDLHIATVPVGSEKAIADLLGKHPQLKFAELDRRLAPSFAVNDPYAGSQWHLSKIGSSSAWDSAQGAGITIAILDSGVDGSHPDLSARMVAGWNFLDNNANAADVNGHGTAVAGAAAATLNNGTGVAGTAGQARIMPVRIADANAYAYFSTIAQGINWAADNGARVANISYAAGGSAAVQSAAQYMKSKGGLVIVAAGNNGIDEMIAPTTTMIIVSATDSTDTKTSWSSYGAAVSLAAPGQDIWTTVRGGSYQAWWGTSLASPVVAGVVGLMMSAKPSLGSGQVESLLFSSATDLGTAGRDPLYGYGRVNAAAAVQASLSAIAADTQAPSATISAPLASSSVSGMVAVDVVASDNVGVTKVELRVNGATVATDTVAPFGFSWDSSKQANGMNTLAAVAFDAAGNSASSATVSVNVANTVPPDTSPPSISIGNPKAGSVVSGSVSISTSASDDAGAAGIKQTLLIDGVQVASGNGASLSYSWNTRKATAGGHVIQALAQDAAGNKSSSSVSVSK